MVFSRGRSNGPTEADRQGRRIEALDRPAVVTQTFRNGVEREKGERPDFDAEHFSRLKGGVDEWNQWRANYPDVIPRLQGANFNDASFLNSPLWDEKNNVLNFSGIDLSNAQLQGANLSGVWLINADLSGAYLLSADLSRSTLLSADLTGTMLYQADLSGARADWAHFTGSNMRNCDLSHASLVACEFWTSDLTYADLTGAQLETVNLKDANVSHVKYKRALLPGRCQGIRAQQCYGDALFRRDVMDQDYLDQLNSNFRREGFSWISLAIALVAGTVLGLISALLIADNPASVLTFRPDQGDLSIPVISAFSLGLALVIFLATSAGRSMMFNLWGLFDYGRSWSRVVIFGALLIGIFGFLYGVMTPEHITYMREEGLEDIWFYPWFIASMGFATLGLSDLAEPATRLGALVMMLNVLSGFVTLGLLVSVLASTFARRS